jgi:hypothetical protein
MMPRVDLVAVARNPLNPSRPWRRIGGGRSGVPDGDRVVRSCELISGALIEREHSSMSIRHSVRRNLVPRLDHLESRQLLSARTSHLHHPLDRHHLVHVAPTAYAAHTAAANSSVNGLNKLTNPNFNGILNATAAVAFNNVWAVGTAGTGATISAIQNSEPFIEHFNGTTWSVVKSPLPKFGGELNGVAALAGNNVWAVGQMNSTSTAGGFPITIPLIEHWNGAQWNIVASPNPSPVLGAQLLGVAAISANNVFAVGTGDLVEHWDGAKWSIVASPAFSGGGTLNAISADSSTDVWAVGANSNGTPLVLHFNGHAWSQVTPVLPTNSGYSFPSVFHGVTAISPTNVWAVGTSRVNKYPFPITALIEHFDGTSWSIVPSPNPEAGLAFPGSFGLVGIAAISATNIWAVGTFNDPTSALDLPLTEHWNGASWSIVSSAKVIGEMNVLSGVTALSGGTVVAVGFATSDGGVDPFIPQSFLTFDQPLILQN